MIKSHASPTHESSRIESPRREPSASGTTTGILARLKEATREHHASIERQLGLMAPRITRAEYTSYLAKMLGYYEPLEAAIAEITGLVQALPDLERRKKSAMIHRDLTSLGVNGVSQDAMPRCETLPRVDSVPRAFGCMYVLEGATLGGQIIARHLAIALDASSDETMGGDPRDATAFVRSYGTDVGVLWRAFGLAIEAYASSPAATAPPHGDGNGDGNGNGNVDVDARHVRRASVDGVGDMPASTLGERATAITTHDEIIAAACETFTTLERWVAMGSA